MVDEPTACFARRVGLVTQRAPIPTPVTTARGGRRVDNPPSMELLCHSLWPSRHPLPHGCFRRSTATTRRPHSRRVSGDHPSRQSRREVRRPTRHRSKFAVCSARASDVTAYLAAAAQSTLAAVSPPPLRSLAVPRRRGGRSAARRRSWKVPDRSAACAATSRARACRASAGQAQQAQLRYRRAP